VASFAAPAGRSEGKPFDTVPLLLGDDSGLKSYSFDLSMGICCDIYHRPSSEN